MPSTVGFVNRHKRRLAILAGIGLIAIAAAYYMGMGAVVDEATGKPLEGVFVVGRWRGQQITPIESSSVCFKIDSTRSDANGRFMLWPVSWNFDPRLWSRERQLMFYKRGYRLSNPTSADFSTVQMRIDDSPIDDRFGFMSRMAMQAVCGTVGQQIKYVLPVYEAMTEEAKEVADASSRRSYLNGLMWLLETLTLGSSSAMYNFQKRKLEARK